MTRRQAIWLAVAAVYFGLLFATGVVATVIYDLIALQHGWRTVSGDTLLLGHRFYWVALIIAGMLGFAGGALSAHLLWPQVRDANGPAGDEARK